MNTLVHPQQTDAHKHSDPQSIGHKTYARICIGTYKGAHSCLCVGLPWYSRGQRGPRDNLRYTTSTCIHEMRARNSYSASVVCQSVTMYTPVRGAQSGASSAFVTSCREVITRGTRGEKHPEERGRKGRGRPRETQCAVRVQGGGPMRAWVVARTSVCEE